MAEQWNENYDVVIVGSGTGLFSGILAANAGLKTLVVEKDHKFGGSTALSGGGMWMPGNRVSRAAGLEGQQGSCGDLPP